MILAQLSFQDQANAGAPLNVFNVCFAGSPTESTTNISTQFYYGLNYKEQKT